MKDAASIQMHPVAACRESCAAMHLATPHARACMRVCSGGEAPKRGAGGRFQMGSSQQELTREQQLADIEVSDTIP